MSIEALRREIISSAEKEREEILNEARKEAEKIINDAKEKAIKIVERKRAHIESQLKNKMEVAMAVKRLEGKRMVYEEIMKLFDEVRQRALAKLSELRNSGEYLNVVVKYIHKGVDSLNTTALRVYYPPDDEDFFKKNEGKIVKEVSKLVGKDIKIDFVKSDERFLGGVIIADSKDQVFYVSTFDGKLKSVFEDKLDVILNILRGG